MTPLRKDLALVASLIPDGSRVLDLGCGSGNLLSHLMHHQGCRGTGVEIDPEKVLAAIRLGVPVIELDINRELDEFSDSSYDVVVLSRTLQTVRYPDRVLRHMARIAGRLIVSVPNFGWYRHRLRMLRGRLPMGKDLPYSWYDSPNVRYTTLVDLQLLFDEVGLEVEQTIPLGTTGDPLKAAPGLANLLASTGVYVLRPASA
ncbi:MAG: methionine biosynthesis protein MetW [Actinobacteria bacterium]|nr:methionine biosynthesis protein MetW [Actinomycetota bacterium]